MPQQRFRRSHCPRKEGKVDFPMLLYQSRKQQQTSQLILGLSGEITWEGVVAATKVGTSTPSGNRGARNHERIDIARAGKRRRGRRREGATDGASMRSKATKGAWSMGDNSGSAGEWRCIAQADNSSRTAALGANNGQQRTAAAAAAAAAAAPLTRGTPLPRSHSLRALRRRWAPLAGPHGAASAMRADLRRYAGMRRGSSQRACGKTRPACIPRWNCPRKFRPLVFCCAQPFFSADAKKNIFFLRKAIEQKNYSKCNDAFFSLQII